MNVEFHDKVDAPSAHAALPTCRFCTAQLRRTFADLGMSPLCESYVPPERLGPMEPFHRLHARVCERCLLVQLEEFVAPEDILPWNLKKEIASQLSYTRGWGARCVVPIPEVGVL